MNNDGEILWKKGISDFKGYRRHLPHFQIPNSVYFITTKCKKFKHRNIMVDRDGRPTLDKALSKEERDIVMGAIKFLDEKKYILYGAVVMPDHFHTVIQPIKKSGEACFSITEIMHSIKSYTAHEIIKYRSSLNINLHEALISNPANQNTKNRIISKELSESRSSVPVDQDQNTPHTPKIPHKSRSSVPVDQDRPNQIWHQENFDRIIRNPDEFQQKIEYMMKNPLRSELAKSLDDYKWLYIKGYKTDLM